MEEEYEQLEDPTRIDIYKEERLKVSKQYSKFDSRADPRFGEIIMLRNKQNVVVCEMHHHVPLDHDETRKKFSEFCRRRMGLDSRYLMQILHFHGLARSDYNGRFWDFRVIFEYPYNDLKVETRYRKLHGIRYTVQELWKVAKCKGFLGVEVWIDFI